ncbi:alpha/beta hydrolase [Amycolatopsis sp. NPDC059657]|uniref:alpha/beta hydrolase n=1 Tax=Amycolatopsis sp. NPDC059657 TaxID=3346899 RepID=UPI0036712B08
MKRALLLAVVLVSACNAPPPSPNSPQRVAAAVEAPAAMGTNGASVPALHWTSCHQEFQCAAAAVPVSYRDPHGPSLNLAVIKLPATDPGHRIGSLFVNFGGPGTDGVSELMRFGARYPDELRARFDLVSFDPRGIGGSSPINCAGAEDPVTGSPLRPDQHDTFYATSARAGQACAAGSGKLLDHLSSANVARDMDLLRQATGDAKLNFLGYSYGTYLGGTYANIFPANLRAMTLDGTLDLVANATGKPGDEAKPVDVRADTARAQLDELGAFFDECAKAACAFAAGDQRQKFADIVARLTKSPVGGTNLAGFLKNLESAFYQFGRWKRLGETLNTLASASPPGPALPVLDPYLPTHSPGYLAVQCVDSQNPQDPAAYDRLAVTEQTRVPYFALGAVFNMAQCIGWPGHDDDRYLGPWNRQRQNPILVINNRHDPATPLHNAQSTVDELGDGRLLVVESFGHTSLNVHSACASAAMVRYFVDLHAPPAGTTCTPDARPFT